LLGRRRTPGGSIGAMRFSGAQDALQLTSSSSLNQGFASQLKMIESLGILFAGKHTALKIKQSLDQVIDDILDPAAIDAHLVGRAVLEDDVDILGLDVSIAPIHTSKGFHVLAHAKSPVLTTLDPLYRVRQ
jgi:hypothetical protein